MRIAFITICKPGRELGGGRAQVELAVELRRLGCTCVVLGPDDLLQASGRERVASVQEAFALWLRGPGRDFDVIDYDHNYLLPERDALPAEILYVARSVLFVPFVPLLLADDHASLRQKLALRIRTWLMRRGPAKPFAPMHLLMRALRHCDTLNVSNQREALLAKALGLSETRIVCLPFGLERERRAALRAVAERPRSEPHFVFLGTYDSRKGGPVLPLIWERLGRAFPGARLSLLGVKAAHESAKAVVKRVRAVFPDSLGERVTIRPVFVNDELPRLLGECGVGLFPSRHEGFPFAVLEQLTAGVPVVAYDAPGACDLLPSEWRVAPGDVVALADRASDLMRRRLAGEPLATAAIRQADRFQIEGIAVATLVEYQEQRAAKITARFH